MKNLRDLLKEDTKTVKPDVSEKMQKGIKGFKFKDLTDAN